MTHFWNPADSFSAGATSPPSPPTAPQHYIKLVPWNVDPAHGSGGTGFSYGAAYFAASGMFYDGWSGNPQSKGRRAAVSTSLTGQTTPAPIAMMPRAIEISDADVSCGIQLEASDITYINANGATFCAGVGARLSGGTVTGSTVETSRLGGGNGYWFALFMDTVAGGAKYELLRVNGSTVTRLAETPSGATTFDAFGSLAASSPRTLRLTVLAESGNVRLRAYTMSAALLDLAGGETLVFDVLDNSGSKLTGAGRCGLLLGSEYQRTTSPVRRVAPVCSFFQIRSGSDVLHRDEWVRAHAAYGLLRYPGFSSHEAEYLGNSLMSGWSGDAQYSNTPTMTHDAAGGRISLSSGGALRDHWWFSQRPADDPRRQNRTVVARFDTSGGSANAAERHVGVFLRGSPQVAVADARPISCYYATISISDTTGVVTVQLRRRTQALGDQLLAQNTALTVTVDANITFGLGVQTLAPDLINGYAQLNVTVNGSAVVLVAPPSPLPGVLIDAAGAVVDATSQRVFQGSCEGIRALIQNANPRTLYIDTWALGAGAGAIDLPESDQAGIAVRPEYTTTVGTLTLPTDTACAVSATETTIRHELDSDHVHTSLAHAFERRTWDVTVNAWTAEERDDFLDLLDAIEAVEITGQVGAFNWTPPGLHEPETVVHFLEEFSDIDTVVPGSAFSTRFKLEELHAP